MLILSLQDYRTRLAPYVTDAVALMEDAQNKNTDILVEGGQALMLDISMLKATTIRRIQLTRNSLRHIPLCDEFVDCTRLPAINHATCLHADSEQGIGGVLTGLAINPRKLAQSIGVVKAYTTR